LVPTVPTSDRVISFAAADGHAKRAAAVLAPAPSSPRPRSQSPTLRVARLPRSTALNPYQATLYRHLRDEGVELTGEADLSLRWLVQNRGRVDVLHFHWRFDRLVDHRAQGDLSNGRMGDGRWEQLAGAWQVVRNLALARALGYRIAWTIHDVGRFGSDGGARGSLFERLVGRALARQAHVSFVHGHAAATIVARTLRPAAPVAVTPLPHYADSYGESDAPVDLRAALGVRPDTVLFLAFGTLRTDKDFPLLLEAFRGLDGDVALAVVGEARDHGTRRLLERAATADPRIRLWLDAVPAAIVRSLFRAADALVLARSAEWTSSSLVLALSFGVPVVAADLATTREAIGPGGWLFAPGCAASLRDALATAVRERGSDRGLAGQRWVLARTWEENARLTAHALRQAAGR